MARRSDYYVRLSYSFAYVAFHGSSYGPGANTGPIYAYAASFDANFGSFDARLAS